MADVSTLLRSVHHALKVPLSSIQNLTELMLLGIEGPMDPAIRQDVQDIAHEVSRLTILTEAVLAYLRLDHQPLHLESVALSTLFQSEVFLMDTPLPTVHTDREIFHEVVKRLEARLTHLSGDRPLHLTALEAPSTVTLLFATEPVNTYQFALTERPQAERHYLGEIDLLFCHRALTRLGGSLGWQHDSEGRVLYSIIHPLHP